MLGLFLHVKLVLRNLLVQLVNLILFLLSAVLSLVDLLLEFAVYLLFSSSIFRFGGLGFLA